MYFNNVNNKKEKIGQVGSLVTIICIYDSVLLTKCLNLIFNAFLLSVDFLNMTVELLFIVLSFL